jgi:cellulose synthase/poly-beta-1,6-N-acetylglucosamine synthase-like glycosyltransferase
VLVWLFWGLVAFCLYAYIGYSLLLFLLSLVRRRACEPEAEFTPTLSIVVPAHNEAGVIGAKLNNLLGQDYPANRLEIIVASDGSDDETESIVSRISRRDPRVKLLGLPRRGKAHALNSAVASTGGEVLVFSDANAMLDPDALCYLVHHFADPGVGGVAGGLRYVRGSDTNGAGLGEMLYWRYDQWLKRMETKVGNAISADGALYAIRRGLYVPIADPSATDDFAISSRVVMQGCRLIYEPRAMVSESTAGGSGREFLRKVRIVNRGLRSLFGLGGFLYPWRGGFYAVQLISHKLLRRLVPFVLPLLLVINAVLWPLGFLYRVILAAQVVVYGLGLLGFLLRNTRLGRAGLVYVPYYFCQANLAAALGWVWLLRGQRIAVWQPQREGAVKQC